MWILPFHKPLHQVLANQTYYYVATSVDSIGNETGDSNQVSATIPTL